MYYGAVEGTDIEVIDPRFRQCFAGHVRVERLWTGARWSEGPAYFAAGRYLIWSDIPNNRMLRFDETDGSVSVFRTDSMNSNGNTVDNQGRLVSCEHRGRRVSRTEIDGSISTLADRYEGKRFNSPERRGGEVRRLDLVHRPRLRHRHRLRRRFSRARDGRLSRLPHRPRLRRVSTAW